MNNTNELIGIINGISYDGIINKLEVARLYTWLNRNRNLSYEPKQAFLISLVEQVLEDGIITDEEREILIKNCAQLTALENDVLAKFYELNGIIEGIICDDEINEKEVCRLQEWIRSNGSFIHEHKTSKNIYEKIVQILDKGIVTSEDQESLLKILKKRIDDTQLETKIEYLRNCVRERKNFGIDLIDLLDNYNATNIIHDRAERELSITLNSYSGMHIQDPEIVFISLVLIGMLYYDGAFYESVRKTYKKLYSRYSEQKIEGLIRTLLNRYRKKNEISFAKSRIINVVLSGSIVPSYYLGSFFEFIYDIYKLNFDSALPDNIYEEFCFVYDGLQNIMSSENDEVSVNVTKKTYKLIKSTKQLIINPLYNDAIIKLSIIVVRLIDKYIWGKENTLYNPYLKKGYEQWLAIINKEKEIGNRNKNEILSSRWKPEFVLNGDTVYLVPPIHRVKSTYDYRDIRIIVKNFDDIIYDKYITDIREIIGGYELKNDAIRIDNPVGEIVYQLVAGKNVIYDSNNRMYRSFIVFDEQGKELSNNKDYEGMAIFCTKSEIDKLHLFFRGHKYLLSSFSARTGDTVLIENKVFNFSKMMHPGVFGEKYDGYYLMKDNMKFEVYKAEIILVFESEFTDANFEIQINQHTYKISEFEYSITERKGVNKYTVKIDSLESGIYQLRVIALKATKKIILYRTHFAIDKSLFVEQEKNTKETYIVSVISDLLEQDIFDEINVNAFNEDWIKFQWNGALYTYYIPLDIPLYRIDKGVWKPVENEIWIDDITQESKIDLYGNRYIGISLLTSTGKIIEETPTLKNKGILQSFPAGFLLSYKTNYDYIQISLLSENCCQECITCYNKCILDTEKTTVSYNHEDNVLVVDPYFYGQGNIKFRIIDEKDNVVFISSVLEKNTPEYVYDLMSCTTYKVIFFEKKLGLFLGNERILNEYPIVFYDRKDFVGKSFKIKEVYFDQFVRGEFLRKRYYFNTTYLFFKKMTSGNEFIGEIYVKNCNGSFPLDNINPVDIEICSDVIDGIIELSITKDGDGLLLDFDHHGIMNSIDNNKAVDIYSYNLDMKGFELV